MFCAVQAHAQDDLNVLPKEVDGVAPQRLLHAYLLGEAKKSFDERRAIVAKLQTPADIRKRQVELKARFIDALGGFPEKSPLNAKVVGTLKGDGYRVEKVIFESRPQHHVTANLYLPEGKGPFPAVLMPIGHSSAGKADGSQQRMAILLAQHGIASFAYDPISQGERRQLLDELNKAAIPSMTNEHTLIGVGAMLLGSSTATYRIWDGMRSLDYLCSRPEIDAKKLGCTGCSGGGTLTSYLMALDERIVAAAPSCYITSLERLFATIGPQDGEQNIPGQVAFGMEHADYLNMRAPLPTLLCAASQDFFDNQGTWTSFREATLTYGMLGHSEKVALVEYNTKHGYPKPQREAIARWMLRWLADKHTAVTEGTFETGKYEDLKCTRSGQVLEDLKGKSVFQINAEIARDLAKKRSAAKGKVDLAAEIRRLLALPKDIPTLEASEAGEVQRQGYVIRKRVYRPKNGLPIPALDFVPTGDAKALVIYVHGDGKATDAGPGGPMEKLVRAGNRVLAIDPRGIGETAPGVLKGPSTFGVDYREAFLGIHLGRPLMGQKTLDVLSVIKAVKGKTPLHIVGIGTGAPIALHVAVLEPSVVKTALEGGLVSWTNVVNTPINSNQLTQVVPGVLKSYDLPDLVLALAPRELVIQQPVDARGERIKN